MEPLPVESCPSAHHFTICAICSSMFSAVLDLTQSPFYSSAEGGHDEGPWQESSSIPRGSWAGLPLDYDAFRRFDAYASVPDHQMGRHSRQNFYPQSELAPAPAEYFPGLEVAFTNPPDWHKNNLQRLFVSPSERPLHQHSLHQNWQNNNSQSEPRSAETDEDSLRSSSSTSSPAPISPSGTSPSNDTQPQAIRTVATRRCYHNNEEEKPFQCPADACDLRYRCLNHCPPF